MSNTLSVALNLFAIIWVIVLIVAIRRHKIDIQYSMAWFFFAIVILLVGVFPAVIEWINSFVGFEVISNLVIAILLTLLMVITLVLTIIVTKQKKQMNKLVQEIALINRKINKD